MCTHVQMKQQNAWDLFGSSALVGEQKAQGLPEARAACWELLKLDEGFVSVMVLGDAQE